MKSNSLSHLDYIRYDSSNMKINKHLVAMIPIMYVAYGWGSY